MTQDPLPVLPSSPSTSRVRRPGLWWAAALVVLAFGVSGAWLFARQGSLVPGIRVPPVSQSAVDPNYIVVNQPTTVTFTAHVATANRSAYVLLLRLGPDGAPVSAVGQLQNNGRNDTPYESTFGLVTTLTESTSGYVSFVVAASSTPSPLSTTAPVTTRATGLPAWPVSPAANGAAQGFDTLAESDPIRVAVGTVILPPDPGDAGKRTLEGIDSDHDGVRDDVQRQIVIAHVADPDTIGALTETARTLQSLITLPPGAPATMVANDAQALRDAQDCLTYTAGSSSAAYALYRNLVASMLNTPARTVAYSATQLSARPPSALSSDVQLQNSCHFTSAARKSK